MDVGLRVGFFNGNLSVQRIFGKLKLASCHPAGAQVVPATPSAQLQRQVGSMYDDPMQLSNDQCLMSHTHTE